MFSGPLRRNSSGTTTWPSSGLLELAVLERKLSLMSPRLGTLVSEQGVEAAFKLGMERKCDVPDSYSRPLASVEVKTLRFASLGRGDST